MACTKPLKAGRHRVTGEMIFDEPAPSERGLYERMELACGQCVNCRVRYAADWSMRFMQESQMHKSSCVLTLTYSDEFVPKNGDLRYEDVQKFVRRLRKRTGVKLLYAVCGEYGDENWRPHYHMIVFGYDFPDKLYWKEASNGSKLFKSKLLEELWPLGHTLVGEMNKDAADYVGRYVVKKVNGDAAKDHYRRFTPDGQEYFLTPEFLRVSKGRCGPDDDKSKGRGIGASWLNEFWSDVFPWDHVVLRGGVELSPPRYYLKLLKRRDAALFDEIKERRAAEAMTPARLAEATPERRHVHDVVARARLGLKRRPL